MSKLYLTFILLLMLAAVQAQEINAPISNSNRIILHFTDTTGKFMQLARIFVERDYDIDMKDHELGVLRTKPSPLRGAGSFSDKVEIKTVFRDSTITFSAVTYAQSFGHDFSTYQVNQEVYYSTKPRRNATLSWEEMARIAALLKPAFITYTTVDFTLKGKPVESWYKRNN